MVNSATKGRISYLWRLFVPAVIFLGVMLLILSLVTTKFQENIMNKFVSRSDHLSDSMAEVDTVNTQGNSNMFWKEVNLKQFPIPDLAVDKAKGTDINIKSQRIKIMNVDTFYREALPPPGIEVSNQSILLLHGASFKSQTWLDLNTINLIAAMGHRVVAVDLPGYGETSSTLHGDNGNYLKELIDALQLKNFVIVSPSMSGSFSIPYLVRHWKDVDGYIPVAPGSTNKIVQEGPNITTPTLIIYGELDRGLGFTSLKHLSHLPNSQAVVLPKAKHPAYLDQPQMFHALIYNFMKQLKEHKQN